MTDHSGNTIVGQATSNPTSRTDRRPGPLHSALRKGRGFILPVLGILLLEGVVRVGLIPDYVMPPPSELVFSFIDLAHGPLWNDIAASLLRVLAGFIIGTALAVIVGSVVGLSRNAEAWLDPTFQALRSVPSLAWVPLLLIWIGIDESSKVTLISIGAFFRCISTWLPVSGTLIVSWLKWVRCINTPGYVWWQKLFFPRLYLHC